MKLERAIALIHQNNARAQRVRFGVLVVAVMMRLMSQPHRNRSADADKVTIHPMK